VNKNAGQQEAVHTSPLAQMESDRVNGYHSPHSFGQENPEHVTVPSDTSSRSLHVFDYLEAADSYGLLMDSFVAHAANAAKKAS